MKHAKSEFILTLCKLNLTGFLYVYEHEKEIKENNKKSSNCDDTQHLIVSLFIDNMVQKGKKVEFYLNFKMWNIKSVSTSTLYTANEALVAKIDFSSGKLIGKRGE